MSTNLTRVGRRAAICRKKEPICFASIILFSGWLTDGALQSRRGTVRRPLPKAERDHCGQCACNGDGRLLERVKRLIEVSEEAPSFFKEPASFESIEGFGDEIDRCRLVGARRGRLWNLVSCRAAVIKEGEGWDVAA